MISESTKNLQSTEPTVGLIYFSPTRARQKWLNGSDISSLKGIQSADVPLKFKFIGEEILRHFYGPIVVDVSKCSKCGACVKVCPVDCIDNQTFLRIDDQAKNCIGCAGCLRACPEAARTQSLKLKWLVGIMAPFNKKRGMPVYYT